MQPNFTFKEDEGLHILQKIWPLMTLGHNEPQYVLDYSETRNQATDVFLSLLFILDGLKSVLDVLQLLRVLL